MGCVRCHRGPQKPGSGLGTYPIDKNEPEQFLSGGLGVIPVALSGKVTGPGQQGPGSQVGPLEIWGHVCRRDREGGTSSLSCDGLSHSLSLKSFILVIPEVPDSVILRIHDSSIPRCEMPCFSSCVIW